MKRKFSFHPQLILRTPALPQQAAFSRDELIEIIEMEDFQEAIYLASPNLFRQLKKYVKKELNKEKETSFFQAIYKYVLRRTNRPTPFGLFSGCTVVHWKEKTKIKLPPLKNCSRKTYLEFSWLVNVGKQIENHQSVRRFLFYQTNSTINFEKDKITFIVRSPIDDAPGHMTAQLDAYLSLVLSKAKDKKLYADLVQELISYEPNLSKDEVEGYLNQLIDTQILGSEFQPVLTGLDYFSHLLNALNRIKNEIPELDPTYRALQQIKIKTQKLDASISNPQTDYQAILKTIKQFNSKIGLSFNLEKQPFFLANLFKNSTQIFALNKGLQNNLLEAFKLLNQLFPSEENLNLKAFTKAFLSRYGDQQVPLLKALDPERGLGYPINSEFIQGELLAGFQFQTTQEAIKINQSSTEDYLLKKLKHFSQSTLQEIDISEDLEAINQLPSTLENWKNSTQIIFSLIGAKNNKPQILLKAIGASTGIFTASRFANGSQEISHLVEEIIKTENSHTSENEIKAEIVFLPNNNSGHLLHRKMGRAHQIPYLTQTDAPFEKKIPPSDLTISIDKTTQMIGLKSKKLNKIIRPILSVPHFYQNSPHSIYRFLGDLQFQDSRIGIQFNWGNLVNKFQSFPRVVFKNIIIAPATWFLKTGDFETILSLEPTKIDRWKKKWNLPDLLLLVEGDNELLVNLKNQFSIRGFVHLIKNKSKIKLSEFLFDKETCPVIDEHNKAYTNELVATLFFKNEPKATSNIEILKPKKTKTKNYLPDSDWLYYKIYCGINFADVLLFQILNPLLVKYWKESKIKKWFFIRYQEDGFHIRLRVQFKDRSFRENFRRSIHHLLGAPVKEGLVSKIQLDKYQKELERYGRTTMEETEELFFQDSVSTVSIIQQIHTTKDESLRWQFALLSIKNYLEKFGLNNIESKNFLFFLIEKMETRLHFNNKSSREILKLKYRKLRPEIELLFKGTHKNHQIIKPILEERNKRLVPIFAKLNSHFQFQKQSTSNLEAQIALSSYLHMHINRLFRDQQTHNEFVIYYLLYKHLNSVIARKLSE